MSCSVLVILPQYMTIEIQCCLGVKDLLRFKCVSKSWCSLIDHPYFIKLHLSHAANSSDLEVYNSLSALLTAKEIRRPYGQLLGSCNGLLALSRGKDISKRIWLDRIWLSNPSTRESRMLPSFEIKIPWFVHCLDVAYGFGYDPISDDYKLIRIMLFRPFASCVTVYSLRTNSWRWIDEGFPYHLERGQANGVLVNNALHWVTSKSLGTETRVSVVAFDLVDEEYRVVELPDCLDKGLSMFLKAIDGCLALIAKNHEVRVVFDRNQRVLVPDVWMMKQYGLKQSWTKLISATKSELSDLRNKWVGNVRIGDLQRLNINVVESLFPLPS